MKNFIGGKNELDDQHWALSLVRKSKGPNTHHAFLILEGFMNGELFIHDAHLVIKKGTENSPDMKADIISKKIFLDELRQLADQCHSITWSISPEQADAFFSLINVDKRRADENKINYVQVGNVVWGDSAKATLFSSSSKKTSSLSKNSVSDASSREGENCASWAIGMVKRLGLKMDLPWYKCIIAFDPRTIIKGTRNADEPKRSTSLGK